MNINFEEYLSLEKEAFDDLDKYTEQLTKIEKASDIGNKVLNFIDEEINNFDKNIFNQIEINDIINKLEIKTNEKIESNMLTEIYSEIEQTFNLGGRVSLEEYLNQGKTIYNDIKNKLKGVVDYGIKYSEEELIKEEENAFNRFCLTLSMHNKIELSNYFKTSNETKELLNKEKSYLNILNGIPYAESIEEKIVELNHMFLSLKQINDLGSKITDEYSINNLITDKIKKMSLELSEYSNDKNIKNLYENLLQNIEYISNSNEDLKEVSLHTLNKLEIINEAIYFNDLKYENDLNL